MRDVYIVGVGMSRFFKWLDRGIKDLTRESITEALNDAGLQKDQIEAAWFANSTWGFFEGQDQVRGQVALGLPGHARTAGKQLRRGLWRRVAGASRSLARRGVRGL